MIEMCTVCGKTDSDEKYGVRGIARIGGNICVECATENDSFSAGDE